MERWWVPAYPVSIVVFGWLTIGPSSPCIANEALINPYTGSTSLPVTGDELRRLRRTKLKLSQAKLGKRLGVTVTSVARWERNERPIAPLVARFVQILAELQTRASPDLAARVDKLLGPPEPNPSANRVRKRKRTE